MLTGLMSAATPFFGVLLALALGLLIGVERGWTHKATPDGGRVAGVRTFALLGMVGGLAGVLSAGGDYLAGAALLCAAATAIVVGYARAASSGDLSATGAVMSILTLGVGMMAAMGQGAMACVAAGSAVLVLAERERLHAWVNGLSQAEVQAIARFGLIALAVTPLLPDRALGPYEAWNPRAIWMVVVLVSGLSLLAYAASRAFGASRGALAAAAAGALASSTAVTAALAARLRHDDISRKDAVTGIALASAVMLARVLALTALLAPTAAGPLALLLGPAFIVSAVWSALGLREGKPEETGAPVAPTRNPFDLGPALLLAALVALLSLGARWALERFGDAGLTVVLGLSGLADVDSAIITLAGLPPDLVAPHQAAIALAAPVLANTLFKALLTASLAGGPSGRRAALPLAATVAAGAAMLGGMLALT